ncbi:MAG TPA: septal ring lytic transglycosylase RlpA family protein [Alphaproteobacteria bacterium]|nr:septal ring lytic transglycosylase RlpA family protein [Alphaproteobacteria bacterium]
MISRLRRMAFAFGALAWLLAGCAETELAVHTAKVLEGEDEEARGGFKIGKPYEVDGVVYQPRYDPYYDETGIASWYGEEFHGARTANGERFDMNAITAAHKTLPMPSNVRITNLENGRSLVVRVNDRGPFVHGRIIDLSRRTAQLLGLTLRGTAMVRVQMLPISQQPEILIAGLRREGYALPKEAEDLGLAYSEPLPSGTIAVAALGAPGSANPAQPSSDGALIASAAAAELIPPESAALPSTPRMYVQAGAFANPENAERVRAQLESAGPSAITSLVVDGRTLYRVRLGPYTALEAADQALEAAIDEGYPEARLIVD